MRNGGGYGLRQIMCGWRRPVWGTCFNCPPTSRIIDIGCGHGRHALAFAERGTEVIGLDSAAALLDRARHLAADFRAQIRWIRGDMRRLPLRSGCADAAMVMDAFGFFDTDEEHETALREAARVVTAGGRLALKVVNGTSVLAAFRETALEERDGVVVSVTSTLTFGPPRMTQRISVSGSRGHGEYERRQRLYGVEELRAALEDAGVSVVGVFATPDGAVLEPSNAVPPCLRGSSVVGGRCSPPTHRRRAAVVVVRGDAAGFVFAARLPFAALASSPICTSLARAFAIAWINLAGIGSDSEKRIVPLLTRCGATASPSVSTTWRVDG
jgi:ubiquinone/menaquinone biosynthesis C-methylase UbiE